MTAVTGEIPMPIDIPPAGVLGPDRGVSGMLRNG